MNKTIEQIRADNEERKRIKATMLARPYEVDYLDDDEDDQLLTHSWPVELVSSHEEPSVAYPGRMARRCVANFTETLTSTETAEGIAFCCNDQPEDDIDQLLALTARMALAMTEAIENCETCKGRPNGCARCSTFYKLLCQTLRLAPTTTRRASAAPTEEDA